MVPAVSVAEADAIQNISEYVGTLSEYDITDAAASIIAGNDDILNVDGVETVTVSDGPVGASDGAIINSFTAEVEFDVSATAAEIAAEVAAAGKIGDELDEANSVVVESGEAVSAEEAQAIIGISGYAGISSDIDIADDAASLISANDAVLNATGVDYIRVDGGIGEGGYGVNAADGAVLTSFSAEIDFDVVDTAQAVAAEVTGTDIRDGSSNSASDLDDAEHIFHYRWFCQRRRCKRYSEYFRI